MSAYTETDIVRKFYKLLDMVNDTRKTQKEYFRTRDKEILIRSKKLESELDNFIKEHSDLLNLS